MRTLALLWQILRGAGFPNQFFCDSWVVGFWRGRPCSVLVTPRCARQQPAVHSAPAVRHPRRLALATRARDHLLGRFGRLVTPIGPGSRQSADVSCWGGGVPPVTSSCFRNQTSKPVPVEHFRAAISLLAYHSCLLEPIVTIGLSPRDEKIPQLA